jgi:crossover junction endodeoxyribonuclease RuvC
MIFLASGGVYSCQGGRRLRVIGIDPGASVTGWGIVEKGLRGRLVHICDGVVRAKGGMPHPERLRRIADVLKKIIEEFKPDHCAVEALFFFRNPRSALTLAEARGAILASAAECGVRVYEYSPRKVKQAVVGHGGATKEQTQKMVKALLGHSREPKPDAADALAVAICHIHHAASVTHTHHGLYDSQHKR